MCEIKYFAIQEKNVKGKVYQIERFIKTLDYKISSYFSSGEAPIHVQFESLSNLNLDRFSIKV